MATKKEEVFESDEVRELIGTFQSVTAKLRDEVGKVIIGQEEVVEHLLITLLVGGHCLITGMPGTAKTVSTTTNPETKSAMPRPIIVRMGSAALRKACRTMTVLSVKPLARAVCT